MLEDPFVLLNGIVDPDREHPVHHLVVADILDLGKPPDAPLRDGADPEFPLGREGPVLDRLPEVRGRRLENFLEVVGEGDVVEEEDGAGPEVVVVVERLVRDGALELVGPGDEVLHRRAGMRFAFARVAGDGDVQPVRVLDRLRGEGHRETFRDGPVADVAPVEGIEEEGERVAVPEDLEGTLAVLIIGRGRDRLLLQVSCIRRRRRFFLRPPFLLLVHPPELRPALRSPAATRVMAAGEDGAVCKLDGECTVVVGRRERALREDVEGAALVGSCAPDGDTVAREPRGEVDAVPAPLLWLERVLPGEETREVLQALQGNHTDLARHGKQLRSPVRPLRGVVALPRCGPVEFPDPGGVVVRGIDSHGLVREEGVQGREDSFHERGRGFVVWKVDPVQQVGAVARVRPDR